jgi:hypothetical protein
VPKTDNFAFVESAFPAHTLAWTGGLAALETQIPLTTPAALFGALDVLIELSLTRDVYVPGKPLHDWCTIEDRTPHEPTTLTSSSSSAALAIPTAPARASVSHVVELFL